MTGQLTVWEISGFAELDGGSRQPETAVIRLRAHATLRRCTGGTALSEVRGKMYVVCLCDAKFTVWNSAGMQGEEN